MSVNGTVEKKATTDAERAKYIKAAILAAAGGAGLGALIRSRKANKARAKEGNPETARNTIIVPIKKTKFLEELPTPQELAASRGEQLGQETASGAAPAAASTPAETGATGTSGAEALTPEQIAAKKKEILGNGRKFNFFGKRAAAKTAQEETGKEKKDEKPAEEKKDEKKDEGRALFRDQEGKFVSPTDPVAVAQAEKDAFDLFGIGELTKKNFNAVFDKPVLFTAGALGSIYIAAKISDAINERRRAKAKERLENAREEYVGLLEGSEKKADDWSTLPGRALGTAFFVPAALTALVASRIIENRKIDKKKQKEMSDSYPDDPIILYKTSAAQEIPIAPETALALFLVKRAMFLSAEQEALGEGLNKEAFWGEDAVRGAVTTALGKVEDLAKKTIGGSLGNIKPPMNETEAVDFATNLMVNPNNNAHLLSMMRGFTENNQNAQRDAFLKMLGELPENDPNRNRMLFTLRNKDMRAKVMDGVKRSQTLQNALVDRFQNDQYADTFGKYREELINNEIGKTFNKDGILYPVISWIVNNLGIGKYMAGNKINAMFAQNRAAAQNRVVTPQATQVAQVPKQAPGAPATPPAPAAKPPSV